MLWKKIKEKMLNNPQRIFTENGAALSYEEVVVYAESLAQRLTGECCAILCRSEMFCAVAILACLSAGVSAVPLSYRYGSAHLKRILDFIKPPSVITDAGGSLEIVDSDTGEYEKPSCRPAFIMCTSGTTGTPKGVMLSEANILGNLRDIGECFDISGCRSILISRPLYHIGALTGEFFISLLNGMDIHFMSEPFNPIKIAGYIARNGINIFCGTPTTLSLLAKTVLSAGTDTTSLKVMTVSGECMTETAARYIIKAFASCNVYHVYGLTEASPRLTYLPPSQFAKSPVSIGIPLKSVELRITDSGGAPVKDGTVGELTAKSPGNMLGYYKQPELTKKALRDGWLRTNDLACVNENGMYEIKGRKDDMIIRSGVNIYPAEIENELKKEEGIREVLAYGYRDENGSSQIGIKAVCPEKTEEELFRACLKRLAPYEMPSKIELVNALEKTGSGKTVRR